MVSRSSQGGWKFSSVDDIDVKLFTSIVLQNRFKNLLECS